MVRIITGPEVTTKSSNSAARVHNNAPALVRFVFRNAVQKVAVVNSLITSDELFLRGVFNLSEVLPVGEVHRFFNRESLECFIALNLLERSELHAPFRYGSALVFDLADSAGEAVQFGQIFGRKNNSSLSVDDSRRSSSLHEDGIEFTREHAAFEFFKLSGVFLGNARQTRENIVLRGCPEEIFSGASGSFTVGLGDSTDNDVVLDGSVNFSPEVKVLSTDLLSKLLASNVNAHAFINAESAPIHFDIFQFVLKS